ncbi:MAG: MarR family transcriptional regulator [Clostridiales bacterium]|jgi:DNA-binding MarR family transcriptional regulator|nr:MarR family transcriptional regulator [Clostridiales bacterium]
MNHFLVNVFNEILRTEEASLKTGAYKNLSVREMHVIEAVCFAQKNHSNTASEIANSQNVTAGTLTTTIGTLERKGFVFRRHDQRDRRVVRIFPTEKGKNANEIHQQFHHEMVSSIMSALSEEETLVFVKGLGAVQRFFETKPKMNGGT